MLGLGQASSAPGCTKCTKIPRPVSWCAAKNDWYKRCDKCRGCSHAKRDAAVAAAAAALQARKDAKELLRCNYCGWQPASEFDVSERTGKHYTNCREHHPITLELKAAYEKTENGKASRKRAQTSEKGLACAARSSSKRKKRHQKSAAMRLKNAIKCAASDLIAGRHETSPTFVESTNVSETAFVAHVRAACAAQGINFDDRKSWQIEHKIPCEAFNFDDPDDVRRCWSLSNVHVMTEADNKEKSWKLLDHWIASAGPSCFPAAWMGTPPTDEMKKAHAHKMLAAKALAESADVEDEENDEENSDEEDDEASEESDDDEQPRGEFENMQGAGSSS